MLRQSKCYLTYPSKTVLEDLITRNGPATYNDWSPFQGQEEEIKRQFIGKMKSRYKQNEFIYYSLYSYKDFNPSSVREVRNYGMLQENGQSKGRYSTLEDLVVDGVESEKVREYVIDMCVGYKINKKSPAVEHYETYTRTVRNYDGDGESEEEKFLQIRNDCEISNDDFEEVIRELPYIIKSIWSYSKKMKANLFSFIFAYMDIKARDRKRSYVNVTDFAPYPTFLLKSDGTYDRQFVHSNDNKYVIYPNVIKVFTCSDEFKAEFNLCAKFMDALSILGIDYRDEDPREYNKEFVDSIVCSYLPSNEEYFSQYKELDVEVMFALKPENILTTSKSSMYAHLFNERNEFDYSRSAFFVSERIRTAYINKEIDDDFFTDRELEVIALLGRILSIENKSPVVVPRQLISFEASGILHFRKEVFVLAGKYFGSFDGRYDYRVSLTKYGQIILMEEEFDDVFYLTIDDVHEALEEYETYGKVQSEACWKCLGADY